jgi:hypothetical protein
MPHVKPADSKPVQSKAQILCRTVLDLSRLIRLFFAAIDDPNNPAAYGTHSTPLNELYFRDFTVSPLPTNKFDGSTDLLKIRKIRKPGDIVW